MSARARSTAAAPRPRRELDVASADGTRLHAEVHGPSDAPVVVLSHGWTCSTLFWAPLLRALPPRMQVVVYDQRGHGRSAAPGRDGYSTAALADDLCAVLEACVPEGTRAVLAGHSMGGMTLLAAADRPQLRARTAAVLLANTGSGRLVRELRVLPLAGRLPRLRAATHRLLLKAPVPLGPVTPLSRSVLRYVTMGPGAGPEAIDLCARIVHACPPPVRSRWAGVLAGLDLEAAVARLDVPAAVLVGSADRLTPPPHARRLARGLPHLEELVELPGIGHMTPLETPDRVAAMIDDLVRAHLETPAARSGEAGAPPHPRRPGGDDVSRHSSLDGQVAVVTGAARGVGALLARRPRRGPRRAVAVSPRAARGRCPQVGVAVVLAENRADMAESGC
ncbi:pimeloyl-ACP methyl ester carboxylesterase [Spinactinospora alkalitolerans]|uniref:Pimeloyl-ACP methyl ester carboxylesterase n=1 Tax=Spinactinospora alkalitolerans TaxID=687207 RepID=A0A852TT37_9ACTN|nr:alpha/beta fold hydrolase [Spinactinospora alkalitolerans]NYE47606.1 pimeloyl-ACP methyl ester carboxylesterase [Spinactinospora alkalitolerans]